MRYGKPIQAVIEQRFSCRTYLPRPIEAETRQALERFTAGATAGPFGTPARFRLVSSAGESSRELRGLGTYGFIQGAQGYIIGAVAVGEKDMEDLGWLLEDLVLQATALGLGTCWLGGTFTRSRFADRIGLSAGETMPAVISVGYIAGERSLRDKLIAGGARARTRLPWERLFFEGEFGTPLARDRAGAYALPLEMVRLGPSASNKQPWRVVRQGPAWHFYLQRTPGYGRGVAGLFTSGDLQRVDMGIAMAHFELTARDAGLDGVWGVDDPGLAVADRHTEYITSWIAAEP
ncbi:MAG TPA: nitroreductase family protein [Anaerolineae bacterium]|nr:nitroreductase family protein [Anaerolineae bacterium]